jgi:hypothetical protein
VPCLENPAWRRRIVLIDSASLIAPEDAGQIIVTGSHGALVGGNAQMALRVDGFAAVFSDAGVGADGAGITRLPALDTRGIVGLTVSAASARIGDAASLYEEGRISTPTPRPPPRRPPRQAPEKRLQRWSRHLREHPVRPSPMTRRGQYFRHRESDLEPTYSSAESRFRLLAEIAAPGGPIRHRRGAAAGCAAPASAHVLR